jgi:hypothetical protein
MESAALWTLLGLLVLALAGWAGRAWRRGRPGTVAALQAELDRGSEAVIRPLEPATFQGAAENLARAGGQGYLALTEARLLFQPLFAPRLEVALRGVEEAGLAEWFRGEAAGARPVLVVRAGGEAYGFRVRDPQAWRRALRAAAGLD